MIAVGTLLVERGTLMPNLFQIGSGTYPNAWTMVTVNRDVHEFEKELADAGWTFLYLAGQIKATAFGFDPPTMINTALKRLMASVKSDHGNCLQIDQVETHSFLGLPYVSVSAHSRHIQKGFMFGR